LLAERAGEKHTPDTCNCKGLVGFVLLAEVLSLVWTHSLSKMNLAKLNVDRICSIYLLLVVGLAVID
jgi:hypothetical protein